MKTPAVQHDARNHDGVAYGFRIDSGILPLDMPTTPGKA